MIVAILLHLISLALYALACFRGISRNSLMDFVPLSILAAALDFTPMLVADSADVWWGYAPLGCFIIGWYAISVAIPLLIFVAAKLGFYGRRRRGNINFLVKIFRCKTMNKILPIATYNTSREYARLAVLAKEFSVVCLVDYYLDGHRDVAWLAQGK